jgi:hypothetical protein
VFCTVFPAICKKFLAKDMAICAKLRAVPHTNFSLLLTVFPMPSENENPKEPSSALTVEQFCEYIAPSVWLSDEILSWPPDVFAIVGALMLKSGAYAHAVSGWQRNGLADWVKNLKDIGYAWHMTPDQPPDKVREWYQNFRDKKSVYVQDICRDSDLCCTLIQLCSAADEACIGIGCTPRNKDDAFREAASARLADTALFYDVSTLCKKVHHSTVRVLPKLHTPQSGITIRSLTHNVALCPAGDVKVKWAECLKEKRHCLNLLLAPWPLQVAPAHFECVETTRAELPDLANGFGFFEYNPPDDEKPLSTLQQLLRTDKDTELVLRLKALLENARKAVSKIDGVVFPELALTAGQHEKISQVLMEEGVFLICGVRDAPAPGRKAAQNYLRFDVPSLPYPISHRQDKHHRWRLDKRQVIQYGLGSCLDVASNWWEHISIGNRELYFVVLDDWLTVCPLICEDLARQDPIGELVRAVGPNLVIALLMDGPQLPSRWPARYATVLADDPGSSVLTLTSIGMAELSRPPSINVSSRAIALWKDAKTGEAISIELPQNKEGVVLSLSRVFVKEYAADGRDDRGATGYPTLTGIHYVSAS